MVLWIIDFFCVLGSWFIDIDTYLYGIPFKDDSEGVVSYSLGEVIWVFHVWGWLGIRILALGSDALILPLVLNLYIP